MSQRTRILGNSLAAWTFGFACVHIAWACGWRGGLDDSFGPIFDRPWFLAYDVIAGLLMYGAAAGALLLVSGRSVPTLRRVTRVAAIGALLRGAPAVVFDVFGGTYDVVGFGADVWFTVAGVAGLLLWAGTRRLSPASAPARRSLGMA
ncbi:hypothetical protein GCM10011492_23800 [Flexivirga endophytica]|uniref:DUF3995 domain-containing protein n=1 Tax=Flexivirga endophytica TaxID=1849103 RepID=A0A916WV28_9MICO|nr:hypothetical protein [Flexivirga endophytica]GGB32380.1 hypothetical protein GCM10011492_23800 [Flexivirga endophytica]GHB53262.1 hypothetical protein GCM10008112_23080 [Flexivirga endophytica]